MKLNLPVLVCPAPAFAGCLTVSYDSCSQEACYPSSCYEERRYSSSACESDFQLRNFNCEPSSRRYNRPAPVAAAPAPTCVPPHAPVAQAPAPQGKSLKERYDEAMAAPTPVSRQGTTAFAMQPPPLPSRQATLPGPA